LRCYALSFYAEKEFALDGVPDSISAARSTADLHRLRADLETEDDPHCLYLLAVVNSKLDLCVTDGLVRRLLITSVTTFPWNWDAWKRLAATVADADEAIFVFEEVCRDRAIRDRASSIAEEDPARSVGRSCIGLLFWAWKCIENDGADEARDLYN
jgi:hypothetical protein